MTRRAIIIGGGGIVGREFCRVLTPHYEVISADVDHCGKEKYQSNECLQLTHENVDITKKEELVSLFHAGDIVINLAAMSRISDCNSDILNSLQINLVGAVNVLVAASEKRCGHVIIASSLYANGHTGGFYSASKRALEQYAIGFMSCSEIPLTVLRLGSLAGGLNDVNSLPTRIIRHHLGITSINDTINSELVRDYLPLPMVAEKLENIIMNEEYFDSFIEFSSGTELNTSELITEICKALDIDEIDNIELTKKKLDFAGQYINSPSQEYEIKKKTISINEEGYSFLAHLRDITRESFS